MTFHPDPGFGHADNCGGGNKPVMGSQLSTLDTNSLSSHTITK
jgi:hypothetical protein